MTRFEEIIEDIKYTFNTGSIKEPGMNITNGVNEKRITTIKEVILNGSKARGAGYRVRTRLQDEFNFVPVTSYNQKIPESDKKTVLYIDLGRIGQVPEGMKEYAKSHDNISLLVIDVNGKEKYVTGFSLLPVVSDSTKT